MRLCPNYSHIVGHGCGWVCVDTECVGILVEWLEHKIHDHEIVRSTQIPVHCFKSLGKIFFLVHFVLPFSPYSLKKDGFLEGEMLPVFEEE